MTKDFGSHLWKGSTHRYYLKVGFLATLECMCGALVERVDYYEPRVILAPEGVNGRGLCPLDKPKTITTVTTKGNIEYGMAT